MIITVDGPSGSGKSSTARLLAKKLGALYLDTGAMYRAVTLAALEKGINPSDEESLEKLAGGISITFEDDGSVQKTFINGRDRSRDIRTHRVNLAVSQVSACIGVRTELVERQRRIARGKPELVAEGRDTGSVVFPDADMKIYLTADEKERATRRYAQANAKPEDTDKIAANIAARDTIDSTRKTSPLKIPDGAVIIDNTRLSLDETLQKIIRLIA
ncbi:MAG: cytidylate kinase [bacterium]|nr:MAG: cytidylate kinase [bacterium]